MKKQNLALFAVLLLALTSSTSIMFAGRWGGHHGYHGYRHGYGGVGFSIGFGSRGYGGPYYGYGYGRPYYRGAYYDGPYYGRTVVIEQGAPRAFKDRAGYRYWKITNNTNNPINVTTRVADIDIQPGQTRQVRRGNNFRFRINNRRFSSTSHYIEVTGTRRGFSIQTSN